jgi:tellurite resistance protein
MDREALVKAGAAALAAFAPQGVPTQWEAATARAYIARSAAVIGAVEAAIRADERKRAVALLRKEAAQYDFQDEAARIFTLAANKIEGGI